MSDKNTKDDDVSKEETGDQKENQNKNEEKENNHKANSFLKKHWESTKEDLRILVEDVKQAYTQAYKSNLSQANENQITAAVDDSNDKKFKDQLEKIKVFWTSLTKRSQIYLTSFFAIMIYSVFFSGSTVEMKQDTEYTRYHDGSCTERSDKICMDENLAKKMCNASAGYTRNVREMTGVLHSGAGAEFVRTGGSLSIGSTEWVNDRCLTSFKISGMFNGTNRTLEFKGYAATFIRGAEGRPLIHYVVIN
jgi:hypothetical protein